MFEQVYGEVYRELERHESDLCGEVAERGFGAGREHEHAIVVKGEKAKRKVGW
jgi:hypothetical protein